MDIQKEILRRYKGEKNYIKKCILTELIASKVMTQEELDKHAGFWEDTRFHDWDLEELLDNLDDIEEYINKYNVFPGSSFEDQVACIVQEFIFMVDRCTTHYVKSLAKEFKEQQKMEDSCH